MNLHERLHEKFHEKLHKNLQDKLHETMCIEEINNNIHKHCSTEFINL